MGRCTRPIEVSDIPRWIELRAQLWPRESPAKLDAEGPAAPNVEPPLIVFVAEENGAIVGFLELELRSVAEGGTSSPVPLFLLPIVPPSPCGNPDEPRTDQQNGGRFRNTHDRPIITHRQITIRVSGGSIRY
jgi:hypothetical protein